VAMGDIPKGTHPKDQDIISIKVSDEFISQGSPLANRLPSLYIGKIEFIVTLKLF